MQADYHYHIEVEKRTLHFKQPAGTSRGVYHVRDLYYLYLHADEEPERIGIGECAPMHDLSCENMETYEEDLRKACRELTETRHLEVEKLRTQPSILFGLETMLAHYEAGSFRLYDTPFARGEAGIRINGLIWMGSYDSMFEQIKKKIDLGFHCIKLKIGAIDFEEELRLLKFIRRDFGSDKIELRVDANGAFKPTEAYDKLCRLAELDLHSIEQPIRAGQYEEMAALTAKTPLPIALDEELIGHFSLADKRQLLTSIRPQYIILKPTLHGGIQGCREWIALADQQHIGWWVTSALESNIGLNSIAQWCATLDNPRPQGLGTGQLFTDNYPLPLELKGDKMWFKD